MSKRPAADDEVYPDAVKRCRLAADSCYRRRTESATSLRLWRRRGPPMLHQTTQSLRLPALERFPNAMDFDVHRARDIDIAGTRCAKRLAKICHKLHGKCKVCFRDEHPAATMNFPCGHVVNCHECGPHMEYCVLCQRQVHKVLFLPRFGTFSFLDSMGSF